MFVLPVATNTDLPGGLSMQAYVLKRLVAVVPVLFGLSIIVFLAMALIPGDTATAILGSYADRKSVV